MDNKNELSISLSVSPVTDEARIDADKYQDEYGVNYFAVKEWSEDLQEKLTEYVEKVVRKADKNGDTILVFPEALGMEIMKTDIMESIRKIKCEST